VPKASGGRSASSAASLPLMMSRTPAKQKRSPSAVASRSGSQSCHPALPVGLFRLLLVHCDEPPVRPQHAVGNTRQHHDCDRLPILAFTVQHSLASSSCPPCMMQRIRMTSQAAPTFVRNQRRARVQSEQMPRRRTL
jgi:hypothetical protein